MRKAIHGSATGKWLFWLAAFYLAMLGMASRAHAGANQLAAAGIHSLYIGSDGKLYAWGSNTYGELADNTTTNRSTPVQAGLPTGVTATSVAAGGNASLALGSDGKVYAWGYNSNGQSGVGSFSNRTNPVQVGLPTGVAAISITAGYLTSFAFGSDGKLYAWGGNSYGQLGDGSNTDRSTPVQVSLSTGVGAISMAAGSVHSLAIGSNGKLYAWGSNAYGQLGDGSTSNRSTPVQVSLPTGVTALSMKAGRGHSLAVGSDGKLYAWGLNSSGQLGDGSTTDRTTPVQVSLPAGVRATSLVAGGDNSVAIGSDRKLYAWGDNNLGQLGDGSTTGHNTPVQVSLPAGVTALSVAAGGAHNLASGSDGKLYAWGYNGAGQLGDGSFSSRYTPVLVSLPAAATVIASNTDTSGDVPLPPWAYAALAALLLGGMGLQRRRS
jgi:alpha-tubulin suppressor-like RCC1 family protein